jgi:ketol-acid reductoisomerase
MGRRIGRPLRESGAYDLRYVEPGDRGRQLLAEIGVPVSELGDALPKSEVVIFAVPDAIVQHVAADVVPRLDSGTRILFLDPAAIHADRIPYRNDISCFVTHPTHPPLYSLLSEASPEARKDYWGGGVAHQALVFATAWGEDADADLVEKVATVMFAPITRSHRITVEQMAMLEPALSETLTNGCMALIREGLQHVIDAGVPEEAAWDFCMGHLQIGIAIIFEQLDWRLSEGAQMALRKAKGSLFRDDWQSIFEPDAIMASVRDITGGAG